jgi:DNA-binding NarL/FixJ family response regulator
MGSLSARQRRGDLPPLTEAAATIAFLAVLYLLVRDRRRAAREFQTLKHSAEASARAMSGRNEAAQQSTRSFLLAMQEQFDAWKLTPAEKDVALLLVKGLSLEEIARVRESGAKTVRRMRPTCMRRQSSMVATSSRRSSLKT